MPYDAGQLERLKTLIRAFAAELDTPAMPYINEGLRGTVTLTPKSDSDRAEGTPGVSLGSPTGGKPFQIYNVSKASELRLESTALKRAGDYLASAEKIVESFRLEGHYNLVNLRNLWKTALCGGDAQGALLILRAAISTYERYDAARRHERLPYPPQDDLVDVLEALQNERSCESRLRDFSGNPAYRLPRPYREIVADVQGRSPQGTTAAAPGTEEKASGGCYIATAVYGSYDAPEVIILRQFRDEHLQRTSLGRGFIAAYYAMSPALARRIPRHPRVNVYVRGMLDFLVDRLRSGSKSGA